MLIFVINFFIFCRKVFKLANHVVCADAHSFGNKYIILVAFACPLRRRCVFIALRSRRALLLFEFTFFSSLNLLNIFLFKYKKDIVSRSPLRVVLYLNSLA